MKEEIQEENIRTFGKDQEIIDERRKQIADAALKLFMEKGYHKTNTREIAEEAGLGKGTLYHYIEKKEDIFYLLASSAFDFVKDLADKIYQRKSDIGKSESSWKDLLVTAIREYLEYVDKNRSLTLFWYIESKNIKGEARNRLFTGHRSLNELYKKILEEGQSSGEFGSFDPMLVAESITALTDMWSFRHWTLKKNFTLDRYIEEQTKFLLKAILK